MRTAPLFYGIVVFLPRVNTHALTGAEAPLITASARAFFIFDTHPTGSLEASIIAYNRRNTTYQVACPTADAACQKEGYWPAALTHIEGSSWIGTNTATAGIEKQWRCRLGSSSDVVEAIPDQYGQCFVTTVDAAGSTTVDPDMPVDTCFLSAHSVVVAVTAGLEKVEAVHPIITEGEYNPSALLSYWSEWRATATCATFTSPAPYTGSVSDGPTTGAAGSASLPVETGGGVTTATGTKSGTEAGIETETGTALVASTSPPASGSSRTSGDFSLVFGAVAAGLAAFL
ncbi:hypothetical protein LY78DRAFT_350772 [Colletotrichum sublineola]|uniref:Uncharacterized protein n=1 Tax=Colletotrichum sublineola TaxID=1173701 RepID=A0A066XNR2_COLSU|nr:hypothetical protein LY78DRAFT_350772 [Colletotrichum sublineola]KDN70562.1 hypothetical protein CSUB01_02003 [Colletotrichum sublineola]